MYHLLSFVNFCGSNERSDSGSSSGCDCGSWSDGCSYSGSGSIAQFVRTLLFRINDFDF